MVSITNQHEVLGFQNLIHGTNEGITGSNCNTLATLFFTLSTFGRCTRATGLGVFQDVIQNVVIIRKQQLSLSFLMQELQGSLRLGVSWIDPMYWDGLLLQVSRHQCVSPNTFRYNDHLCKPDPVPLTQPRRGDVPCSASLNQ